MTFPRADEAGGKTSAVAGGTCLGESGAVGAGAITAVLSSASWLASSFALPLPLVGLNMLRRILEKVPRSEPRIVAAAVCTVVRRYVRAYFSRLRRRSLNNREPN